MVARWRQARPLLAAGAVLLSAVLTHKPPPICCLVARCELAFSKTPQEFAMTQKNMLTPHTHDILQAAGET